MKHDYDVLVIGAGPAGLAAAREAALTGASVALAEHNVIGGEFAWYGCIPSKALLRSAGVFSMVGRLEEYGISAGGNNRYDTGMVMSHVRELIKKTSLHIAPAFLEREGIRVLYGSPEFIDGNSIRLEGETVTARRFIICTGSRSSVPSVEGIDDIVYFTNENFFNIELLPRSLTVIGGGATGVEIAQAMAMLGVDVSLIESADRILTDEDEEAARIVEEALNAQNVKLYAGRTLTGTAVKDSHHEITFANKAGFATTLRTEMVFISTGRRPNIEGLKLEKAGVKFDENGIHTDLAMKTSADSVYACGDVTGPYRFAHVASHQAGIAAHNALGHPRREADYSAVPWVVFTSPEIAHLGPTEKEARERYDDVEVYKAEFRENDRALTDLEDTGMAKVLCRKDGEIIGAHIAGERAGEIIHEYVLAKTAKISLGAITCALHAYPTLSEIVRKTSEQYNARHERRLAQVLEELQHA